MGAPETTTSRRLLIVAVGAFILLGAAIDLWRRRAAPAESGPVRLTRDAGLTTHPALSPDGKLLAYAADRGGSVLNIWMQPVAGGTPVRLTTGDADSHSPAFSHDGARIAFRSEAGEGGLFTVPARGGEPVWIAAAGHNPRFSPDGKWLAWWAPLDRDRAELRVAPATGGPSRRLCEKFRAARHPVWSPDGRHLLFAGVDENGRRDWYVVPAEGGEALRTGARLVLQAGNRSWNVIPSAWVGDDVYLLGGRERSGVWRAVIAPPVMQFTTAAAQVTGDGIVANHASVSAAGDVAYATAAVTTGVWMLRLDRTGAAEGEPVKIADAGEDADPRPSISADGRRLLYQRDGRYGIKDLEGGQEKALDVEVWRGTPAVISPDGARVAYVRDGQLYSAPIEGGEPQLICRRCRVMNGWSADSARVLFEQNGSIGLAYPGHAERQRREFLRHPSAALREARFSPDNRWIAVQMERRGGSNRQIWIVPFREGPDPAEDTWIAVTEEDRDARYPCWSAAGDVLYYLSGRDGFHCIWGRRLDRTTGRPRGEPFAVRHFHQARYSLAGPRTPEVMSLASARGRLVFTLHETTGDLWLLRTR